MEQLLMKASKEGSIDGLYKAIRENPQILSIIDKTPFVDTPLHVAAASGHLQFAMEIMRLSPSFARKLNYDGFTPIHIALQKKHIEMVVWLIETSDSEFVRVKGREGITPLHFAVQNGICDLVDRFLSVCPKSIEDVTIRKETALHIALKNNMLDIFESLINRLYRDSQNKLDDQDDNWRKVILNCKDVEGNTILHIATIRNQPQALQVLIKYKNENPGILEADTINKNGKTASDLVASPHIKELVRQVDTQSEAIISINSPEPKQIEDENQNITTPPLDRESIYAWENYFGFDFEKDKRENTRSDLLVVAVLMATATYQAGLSPPGGLRDDKPESLLAATNPQSYISFITFNTVGFILSLNTIRILIYKYPLYWETYFAMFGMLVTYHVSITAITPPGYMADTYGCINVLAPVLVVVIPFFMRKYIKGSRRRL